MGTAPSKDGDTHSMMMSPTDINDAYVATTKLVAKPILKSVESAFTFHEVGGVGLGFVEHLNTRDTQPPPPGAILTGTWERGFFEGLSRRKQGRLWWFVY